MNWIEQLNLDKTDLLPGASHLDIEKVEKILKTNLPTDFKEFLLWADGGQIANKQFIIFSSGKGIHPNETLVAMNKTIKNNNRFINLGRDAYNFFGFKVEELVNQKCPIYFINHETGQLNYIRDSFENFLKWILGLFEQPLHRVGLLIVLLSC